MPSDVTDHTRTEKTGWASSSFLFFFFFPAFGHVTTRPLFLDRSVNLILLFFFFSLFFSFFFKNRIEMF